MHAEIGSSPPQLLRGISSLENGSIDKWMDGFPVNHSFSHSEIIGDDNDFSPTKLSSYFIQEKKKHGSHAVFITCFNFIRGSHILHLACVLLACFPFTFSTILTVSICHYLYQNKTVSLQLIFDKL